MIKDSSRAATELRGAITADAAAHPPETPPMSPQMSQDLQRLRSAHGPDFDRTYVAMMLREHEDDVGRLRTYARGADDLGTGIFARRALPVVATDMRHIARLQRKATAARS
ncbi:MAG: DUF4142 domain-containing protein [Beijerinckiaceae bacterium]